MSDLIGRQQEDYEPGFDLRESRARSAFDPDDRYGVAVEDADAPGDELDGAEMVNLHGRLMQFYYEEVDRQRDNREQMAVDRDFYDGIQWTAEERRVLMERNQHPMVLNVIAQTVNWVTGTEKRGRTDFRVLPRRKEGSSQAEKKTQLLKYLSDVNDTTFHRSRAFEDAVIAGIGWLEDGLSTSGDGELLSSRYEDWRNMLYDSASTEMDLSDARYVFRSKWVDLDVACGFFPNRAGLLQRSAGMAGRMGSSYGYHDDLSDQLEEERDLNTGAGLYHAGDRKRVKLIECWFYRVAQMQHIRGSEFHGDMFDPQCDAHRRVLDLGEASLVSGPGMRMQVAILTSEGMLWMGESPYRHNRFPFTPIFGYRFGRTGLPYGMVRNLRDIQEDINKRFSKALFILSTNKVIVEEGAITNMAEFINEVSRPDGIIQLKSGKIGAIKLDVDRELAPAHLQLMQQAIGMVQQVGGVTDEMLGRTTNATSGVAVQARQNQGMMQTSKLFDNLRLATKLQGEKQLSLIEQFFSAEKQFRITNMRNTPEYISINDGLPENDITRTKADFIIGEADWRATIRQAQADQLLEVLTKMPPEISLTVLDLVIEHMDIPNVEEIVKRIRAVNGQRDPDAEEPTPEEMQRMQQQAKQQELQLRQIELALKKLEAEGSKLEAQTELTKAQTVKTGADTVGSAVTAAFTALKPGVAPVADQLLDEAGFVPKPASAAVMAAMAEAQKYVAQAQQIIQAAARDAEQRQQTQEAAFVPQQQPGITGIQPGA